MESNYETLFVLSPKKEWEDGKPKRDKDGNVILVLDGKGQLQYDVLAETDKGLSKVSDVRAFSCKDGQLSIKRFVGAKAAQTTFADVRARILGGK